MNIEWIIAHSLPLGLAMIAIVVIAVLIGLSRKR